MFSRRSRFPARPRLVLLMIICASALLSSSRRGASASFAHQKPTFRTVNLASSRLFSTTATETENPYSLPTELKKIADAFEMIGDDKLRYKQLLFMANQAKPMDPASQIPEVYVDGTAEPTAGSADDDEYRIQFVGDSDGLLTKGLVALLVRGLSGSTAAEIQKVDPAFIQKCGIAASLTPGRNNGFLNMLAVMKKKALELEAAAKSSVTRTTDSGEEDINISINSKGSDQKPMYTAIMKAMQQLKPETLELQDVSYQHAGHVEGGNGEESHFELNIVADAFEGLNLVKRHKLIYMMLGDVMPKIHALQIRANTPQEVAGKK